MTFERNRFQSHDSNSATASFDLWPADLFGQRKESYGVETFITEFRPVLFSFVSEIMLYDDEIDLLLDVSFLQFRDSKQTLNWHKTVNYRGVISKILITNILKHESRRRIRSSSDDGIKHVIDLSGAYIAKRLSIAWREHVVTESWQRLRHKELETGRPYFSVLQRRYEKPWMSNGRLLHDLTGLFKTMPTKQAFRIFLHRCELRLARNIVTTAAETIHMPTPNAVLQEMSALDLAHFWERLASTATLARLRKHC